MGPALPTFEAFRNAGSCGCFWFARSLRWFGRQFIAELIYREIQPHDFRRVYELDPSIDVTRVGAKIDDGILTVTLPKAETVKPRKISVQ